MSYVLRSMFRCMNFRSISIASSLRNHGFWADNCSLTKRSTFSSSTIINEARPFETPDGPQKEKDVNHTLTKKLVNLDMGLKKRGVTSLDGLNEIMKILETRKCLSKSLALKLILCCGSVLAEESPLTRIELVQRIWKSFTEYGLEFNIDIYNALLRVYIENEFPFNPDEIMKELNTKELVPNPETYQFFIARHSRDGDLRSINRWLEIMREKQVPIMVDIYRSLIICHFKNGHLEKALNVATIVEKMEPQALPLVYSTLVIEYVKRKEVDKALEILNNSSPKNRYSLNEYFDVLYELAIQNYEKEFLQLLKEYKHPVNYNSRVPFHIIKLVFADRPEYAYHVLRSMHQLTRPTGSKISLGPFFISSLVKNDVPCHVIVKLCLHLMKTEYNELALQLAMHESLRTGKEKLALSLFHAAKSNNLPIRLHYFWPLLLNRAKNKDQDGVFYLLDIMYNHYGLVANSETLRFYIIPYIYSKTMDVTTFMYKFKPYGVTLSTLVNAIVHHLLVNHEYLTAAEVAESFGATYPIERFEKITVDLYVETKDCLSFVKLMKAYCMGSLWQQQYNNREEEDGKIYFRDGRNFFDTMVYTAVTKLMKEENCLQYIPELFQCLLRNKLTLSSEKIEMMEKLFNGEQLEYLSSLLEQLKLETITTVLKYKSESNDLVNEKFIERLYEDMESGDEASSKLGKKYLFNLYAKHHNLEKLLQLKQKLESENYEITSGMYSQVLDTLVEHKKWEDALEIYRNRIQEDEQFRLNSMKLNRFASLLVQNDRIEDAYEILSKKRSRTVENPKRVSLAVIAYSELLKSLAKKGDVKRLEDFFKLYQTHGLGNITEFILEPLIEIHLMRNDVTTALKEYVKCVVRYNSSPCKEKLMRALAVDGDKDKLSEFLSASSSPQSEGQTLYDLIIVYSELGKIKEARRVLQSRILKLSRGGTERLTMACDKYYKENDTKNLLSLFFVTRNTKSFERESLCSKILTTCINTNDVEKAQLLWTEMQDENIVPSSDFFNSLAKLLKSHKLPVDFDHDEKFDETVSMSHPASKSTA